MIRHCRSIVVLSACLLFCTCRGHEEIKTIKLAHSLSVLHPVHLAMKFMSEELERVSNGALRMEIYPASQLGSEQQSLELLQIGSLGMTKVSAAVMENFIPRLKIFGYPYLFEDDEHRFKVYDGPIGKRLLKEGEAFGLRGLTYFDAGKRSFYSKSKLIDSPEDLSGLKVRVMQSPTAITLIKKMGGAPTPISWGELYTALQQGVVDAAENNLPSFYNSRHYEVCRYFSMNEHTSIPDVLVISTWLWNKLSEEERAWLQEAVAKATDYQRQLWAESEKTALEALLKAGVEIHYPDKQRFKQKVDEMFTELETSAPELFELVREIKQEAHATAN